MASSSLEKILQGSRKFIPFKFEGVTLYARKLSQGVSDEVNAAWDAEYNTHYLALLHSEDNTSAFQALKRADTKTLARYISRADQRDLSFQAASECDDKPLDDPEVIERTNELIKEREADLLASVPEDKMLDLAIKRRAHFNAADIASTKGLRFRVRSMVYGEDKEPLFDSDEDVLSLTAEQFSNLLTAVTTALNPAEETALDPLL